MTEPKDPTREAAVAIGADEGGLGMHPDWLERRSMIIREAYRPTLEAQEAKIRELEGALHEMLINLDCSCSAEACPRCVVSIDDAWAALGVKP